MHQSLNRTCRWPEWEIWISVSCHPLTQLQRSKMMKQLCWSALVLSAASLCLHSQAWPLFVLWLHYKGQGAYTLPRALLIKHWVCTRHAELIKRWARASRPPAKGGPTLGGFACRKLCSFHTDWTWSAAYRLRPTATTKTDQLMNNKKIFRSRATTVDWRKHLTIDKSNEWFLKQRGQILRVSGLRSEDVKL